MSKDERLPYEPPAVIASEDLAKPPRYWVAYEVLESARRAGPYDTLEEAQRQADDIAGYDHVRDVKVEMECA